MAREINKIVGRQKRLDPYARMWLACIIDAMRSVLRMPEEHQRLDGIVNGMHEIESDFRWLLTTGIELAMELEQLGVPISAPMLRDWVGEQTWRLDVWHREYMRRIRSKHHGRK